MKNIIVMDESGNQIGLTYPKRAKGLIRHGRAVRAGESAIRLTGSCPSFSLEEKTMAAFQFKPECFHADAADSAFSRDIVSAIPGGTPTEAFSLGDASGAAGTAVSDTFTLSPDAGYTLTFWLRFTGTPAPDASCECRIQFPGQQESIYRLLPDFIRPVKSYMGWMLYEIPFDTKDSSSAVLSFSAKGLRVTVMPAGNVEDYANLAEPAACAAAPAPDAPQSPVSPVEDARAEMLRALTGQMERLDMSSPWCVDALKEMKDMAERILRQY